MLDKLYQSKETLSELTSDNTFNWGWSNGSPSGDKNFPHYKCSGDFDFNEFTTDTIPPEVKPQPTHSARTSRQTEPIVFVPMSHIPTAKDEPSSSGSTSSDSTPITGTLTTDTDESLEVPFTKITISAPPVKSYAQVLNQKIPPNFRTQLTPVPEIKSSNFEKGESSVLKIIPQENGFSSDSSVESLGKSTRKSRFPPRKLKLNTKDVLSPRKQNRNAFKSETVKRQTKVKTKVASDLEVKSSKSKKSQITPNSKVTPTSEKSSSEKKKTVMKASPENSDSEAIQEQTLLKTLKKKRSPYPILPKGNS